MRCRGCQQLLKKISEKYRTETDSCVSPIPFIPEISKLPRSVKNMKSHGCSGYDNLGYAVGQGFDSQKKIHVFSIFLARGSKNGKKR